MHTACARANVSKDYQQQTEDNSQVACELLGVTLAETAPLKGCRVIKILKKTHFVKQVYL